MCRPALLTRQSRDTREFLAFEQFERRSTTCGYMAELVLNLVLGCNSCGVSTTDDDDLAALCSCNCRIKGSFSGVCEGIELKDPRWAVPEDRLSIVDGALE